MDRVARNVEKRMLVPLKALFLACDVIADGVAVAAKKLGPEADAYAMHVGGQELPMHDPKLQPEYHTTYRLDPTPARHTQYEGASRFGGPEYPAAPTDSKDYTNRGEHHKGASEYMHVVNAAGMCQFIMMPAPTDRFPQWVNKVTGWDISGDDLQAAVALLRDQNRTGKRKLPDDPPMPFAAKHWPSLILQDGQPKRRMYELPLCPPCEIVCEPGMFGSTAVGSVGGSTAT